MRTSICGVTPVTKGITGQIGDGISLSSAGLELSGTSGFDLSSGYAVSFWATITSTTAYAPLIRFATNTGTASHALTWSRDAASPHLRVHHDGSSYVLINNGYDNLILPNIGVKRMYTLKWDGTNLYAYYDTTLAFSAAFSTVPNLTYAVLNYFFF